MDAHSSRGIFLTTIRRWFRLTNKIPKNIKQLQSIIADYENHSILPQDVARMLEGVLQVSNIRTADVMIPYSQIVCLNIDDSIKTNIETISKTAHSRFPVISSKSPDKIAGVLLAKDLLYAYIANKNKALDINDSIRQPVFVPEGKRLNVLLTDFRNNQNHIAIVVDEYGNTVGMVTLEDALEQIVGDITDEHDIDERTISQHSKVRFNVKASTTLKEFNQYFASDLSLANTNTIGGFVINSLGHLPKRNEILTTKQFRFRILRADKRRMHLLQVNLLNDEKKDDANINN